MINKTTIAILIASLGFVFAVNSASAHHVSEEIPVSTSPMKMSLSGDYIAVSNLGQREISVIDTKSDQVVQKITTSAGVVAVEIVPEKNQVYAATFESGGIDVYDLNSGLYVKTIDLPDSEITVWHSPQNYHQEYLTLVTGGAALGYNPNNKILFVANFNSNYVATIDTNSDTVLQKIPVSPHPYALKVDTVTGKVLVANMAGNEVTFLSKGDDGKYAVSKTVKTGTVPWGIAIDGMEHRAYVTHRGAHHITVLDTISERIAMTIPVGDDTQAIAVDTNEHQVYVSYLQQNKIIKIDAKKNQIVNTIDTGALAWDLLVDSNTHKIYASIKNEDKVFVMGPQSIATSIPIVTMQTPVALVGDLMIHGQDVFVTQATVDIDSKAIVLNTQTEDGGMLTMGIPRMVLDAKNGDKDSKFFVYADNKLIDEQEMQSDESTRVISVLIPKDTESVTISGTNAIPEFGPIAIIILVVGIVSSVFVTRRTHLYN
ncbi:MAG TPA: YncE family protein [Candidatus Nitrosotenuis sp.]|nr:YncE family protein [Candidatus Nitrosotenuis sp.]